MTCEKCGETLQVGAWPFCPHGYGTNTVIGDEMDQVIENNGTNAPIRFRSKAALAAHMAAHGRTPMVRHVPLQGTDRSPHTTDWGRGIDATTLNNARILTERAASRRPSSGDVQDDGPTLTLRDWTVRTLDSTFTVKADR